MIKVTCQRMYAYFVFNYYHKYYKIIHKINTNLFYFSSTDKFKMVLNKILIIRASLVLNAVLAIYLCMTWFSLIPSQKFQTRQYDDFQDSSLGIRRTLAQETQKLLVEYNEIEPAPAPNVVDVIAEEPKTPNELDEEPPREVQESQGVTELLSTALLDNEVPDPPLNSLERKMYPNYRDCITRPQKPFYSQRGDYWILENYIPAVMSFRCDESITYTTHAEYSFLDNLDPLTSRWQVSCKCYHQVRLIE